MNDESVMERELLEEELCELLLDKNVRLEDVQFIFKRFAYAPIFTRPLALSRAHICMFSLVSFHGLCFT